MHTHTRSGSRMYNKVRVAALRTRACVYCIFGTVLSADGRRTLLCFILRTHIHQHDAYERTLLARSRINRRLACIPLTPQYTCVYAEYMRYLYREAACARARERAHKTLLCARCGLCCRSTLTNSPLWVQLFAYVRGFYVRAEMIPYTHTPTEHHSIEYAVAHFLA